MNIFLRGKTVVAFFFLPLFLFTGCATKVAGLSHDPSFNHTSIINSKMVIGGVTSTLHKMKNDEVIRISSLMREQILEKRGGYPIIPAGVLAGKMGMAPYMEMLQDYALFGVVDENSLSQVAAKIPEARYAIFSKIEEDNIDRNRTQSDITKEKEGKKVKTGAKITSKVTRRIKASLNVFDLETKNMVWGGSVTKSSSASRDWEVTNAELAGVAIGDILRGNRVNYNARYPFPKTPPKERVLKSIYSGFAENMPEPGK